MFLVLNHHYLKTLNIPQLSSSARCFTSSSCNTHPTLKLITGTFVGPIMLSNLKLYQRCNVIYLSNLVHQKINHFPGMYSLARKNHLGRNLNKMQKQFQDDYDFYPRTWLLPSEYGDFKNQFQKGKAKTFIVKPEASCQGKGIFLTRSIDAINPQEHYVA